MLIDANVLLYAVDETCPEHVGASRWLESALSGPVRIAFPWQTIGAFLRIVTDPRVYAQPLTAPEAWSFVDDWLACSTAWIPPTGHNTARILRSLMIDTSVTGSLVTDAQLAAIAIEHGLAVCSADTDFARFPDCRWVNPLTI
ncbi:MAG: TA system VapC family ribonuclease toxin [Actinomycetes bacterium]